MLVEMTGALLASAGDSWVRDANGMIDVRVLTPSSTSETFHVPSADYGYAPWISSADGTERPVYTSMVMNNANLTVTVNLGTITIAQTGGSGSTAGTDCTLQLRIVR